MIKIFTELKKRIRKRLMKSRIFREPDAMKKAYGKRPHRLAVFSRTVLFRDIDSDVMVIQGRGIRQMTKKKIDRSHTDGKL